MGLAAWAAKLRPDLWVLLIDGDMHVRSVELKMCPVTDMTLAEVLNEDKPVEEAVYSCELESDGKPLYPRLAVLPAGGRFLPSLQGNPLELINQTKRKFDEMIASLRKRFPLIIIDTPASVSFEHLILTTVADGVIYVVEPNDDSMKSTAATANDLKKFMDVQPVGVVLNRVPAHIDERGWLRKAENIAPMLGVVPEDDAVGDAFRQNMPVVAISPDCPASRALERITRKVLAIHVKSAIPSQKLDQAIEKIVEELKTKKEE